MFIFQSVQYETTALEHLGHQVLKTAYICMNIGIYASPIVLTFMWKRGFRYHDLASGYSLTMASWIFAILFLSVTLRGIGRMTNPDYTLFLKAFDEATEKHRRNNLSYSVLATQYDCSFEAFPVSYSDATSGRVSANNSIFKEYFTLGGLAAHLFGRHLIYPGSILLLQAAFNPHLEEGRMTLAVKHQGKRAKIETRDGNFIDTMFVDRRNT